MKHRVACVLVFLLCLRLCAQTNCDLMLSGRVVDEHDDSALSFAYVFIENTDKMTVSDEAGNYRLEGLCAGTWVFVCTHIGCEPVRDTIVLQANQRHDFFPEHHAEMLKGVSVEATRNVADNVAFMQRIERTEEVSGQSLGKTLEGIAGVTTLNTGGNIAKPIIHGLHSNRLLVVNNGVRQEGQQWGNEHAPEIDPAIAGQLAVVKGAASVQYGTEAVGGVVLVNPAPLPDTVGMGGLVRVSGQTNGRGGQVGAMLQGRHERFQAFRWRAQGSAKKLGDQHTPDYFLKNTGVEEWNFSTAASLGDERKGVEVFYSQFNTNLAILSASHIGNLTDLERAFESPVPLETSGFSHTIGRPYQHVEHELAKVSAFAETYGKGRFSAVYGRQYNLRSEFDKHRGADSTRPGLQFEIVTHSVDLGWEKRDWNRHLFKVGISALMQENTYEGRFFIPGFHKWAGGIFALDQWTSANGWLLEAGARMDYVLQRVYLDTKGTVRGKDHAYVQPSFSVGASKRVGRRWQWKVNLATAWRPPNASELYSNGLHHGAATFEVGDTTLRQEVSYSAITAIGYQGERLEFETELFANLMNGFIYLVPQFPPTLTIRGAFPTYAYRQTDALLYGLDCKVSYRILPALTAVSNTAILRTRDVPTGDWLAQMPADQSSIALRYEREGRKLTAFASPQVQWVNKQWRVPSASDYVSPPKGFALAHFLVGVSTKDSKGKTHINIEINNLFNQRYRSYLNRYRYFADEAGRNFTVRLTKTF